jgi:ATP-dependent RNA helicase HelY
MDEVHYLADRERGAVWEEVIIHLPEDVQVTALSATVSNAEEFGEWLGTVRGDTEVVVEEHRPVPLWQHVLVGSGSTTCSRARRCNPQLERLARDEGRLPAAGGRPGRAARGHRRPVGQPPGRADPAGQPGLLPAITFIFSRAGLRGGGRAVRALRPAAQHRRGGRAGPPHVERRTSSLPREDLRVLGYWEWLDGLQRGFAAHHAGMLPTFKEVVEELFTEGLVKACSPPRRSRSASTCRPGSVVLEKL